MLILPAAETVSHCGTVGPSIVCETLGGSARPPKLLDRVREALRVRHHRRRTEESCVAWIRRFIVVHGPRHPIELREAPIGAFLSAPATPDRVSASTQNQALCARLRIKDVDFAANQITVRGGKGDKDRLTLLPATVTDALARHVERVRALHQKDSAGGTVPGALRRSPTGEPLP